MRTYTNEAITIEYPDDLAMAFDGMQVKITSHASESQDATFTVAVEDNATLNYFADTRTMRNGVVVFDVAPYARALMEEAAGQPFEVYDGNWLPLLRLFNIYVNWAGVDIFSFQQMAMWGSVAMGETFNASKTIRLWEGYPNQGAVYVGTDARLVCEGSTVKVVGPGVYSVVQPFRPTQAITFADGSTDPMQLASLSNGGKTLKSKRPANAVADVVFDCSGLLYFGTSTTGGVTYLTMTNGDTGAGTFYYRVTVGDRAGYGVASWAMTVRATSGNPVLHLSNGDTVYLSDGEEHTISVNCEGADADYMNVVCEQGASLLISRMTVNVRSKANTSAEADAVEVSSPLPLTFERVSAQSMPGRTNIIRLTLVEMEACSGGVFLRWLDRHGFPVSWLFRAGVEDLSVKASSSLRMNTGDNTDPSVLTLDDKTQTRTQNIAWPQATAEEWEVLRGVLTSPVVELWDKDGGFWQRVNVKVKTKTRTAAPMQDFEIVITLPEEGHQRP